MSQGISLSHKSLLFDYLSFCKSINIHIIKSIISLGTSSPYIRLSLQREFYRLFMKKCSGLKYLDMKLFEFEEFYFPEVELPFESLHELICNTYVDSSYFHGLARVSHNIQRINIVNKLNTKANLGIARLIEVQKNLKYFEWKDYSFDFFPRVDPYKEVLIALGKKANTINHLKLYFKCDDNTLFKVLPKLHNLKSLIINYLRYSNIEQLERCFYHDLEIFKIDHLDLKASSIIIENSGGQLKKILIEHDGYVHNFNKDSLIYIRKIHENCPLIEYLYLAITPTRKHLNELEKLLEVCQNLKSLLLIIRYHVEAEEEFFKNEEEILKILIRSKPTNLREIKFFHEFRCSLKALEEFFEKWNGHALSIVTSDYIHGGNDQHFVELINKYKDNGVLKDFKCETIKSIMNMGFEEQDRKIIIVDDIDR
ncbi:hypothetical protein GLOIN_2v1764020 [Rhizophagus clarus]|uniref:Uncharacterized protein n=1 Tax=Rhizophagus clarus TaxID=94130 RepID=A0A8H3QE64_9GLOM|nr:hypothetical protein GLOIN_2v1764020 [Rhizophagus clarus]